MLISLLGLPLAPVRGVGALARLIQQQAERELYDPAAVWRELDDLEAEAAAGRLTEDELAEAQQRILDRLTA
ncbi:gas vesicle protein GvpG [Micromonospora zhanjiangensis]|uniref:Gas vesicle protein GvpG n=1 Tax=Micromonospora zhanjiangensis TaxID=1522057 RepID=A0ABV8KKG4_9ACTN